MVSSTVGTTNWKIWLIILVVGITGCAMSQNQPDINLTPPITMVEKYVSNSHYVLCTSPKGVDMRWTRDSAEQIPQGKGSIHTEPKNHGVALVFENISSMDKGNYTCRATVDNREVQTSFKLIVIKPMKFVDRDTNQTVKQYQNVTLRCEVDGDPLPMISWTVNGQNAIGPKYKQVEDGLYIQNVTREDKGNYSCHAYQLSSTTSKVSVWTITLQISHPPEWCGKEGSDKTYAFITGTANLTCPVSAEPKPQFEWFKSKKNMSQKNVIIIEEGLISILQLNVNNKHVFGDYVCRATNSLGKMEHVIKLMEGSKPGVPKVSVHGARHDCVQIDIEDPQNEELDILGYRVQYLREQELNKGWDSAQVQEFNKGETPYNLSGLSQNTPYTVRVAARNIAGFSDYTQVSSFTTQKIQADSVTRSTSTAICMSLKASQLIMIIVFYNIISMNGELYHNL